MRRYGLTIAVVAALSVGALGAGTAAAPVLAASSTASSTAGTAGASTSALGGKKKAAKKRAAKNKALRKCRTKRSLKRRKACRRNVKRRFARKPVKPEPPATPVTPVAIIDVRDDYYSPDVVNIKSGDSIKWVWHDENHDPHGVSLTSGPEGVDRYDFETSSSPASGYTFTRRFIVPGTYNFVCTLHVRMTMTVNVS